MTALEQAAAHLRSRDYAAAERLAASLAGTASDAGPLHVLAEARLGQGRLDEAAADFESLLRLAPFEARLWTGRADLELWRAGLEGWEGVIDRGLARPMLPPDVFHLLVRKAVLLWMRRDQAGASAIVGFLRDELARQGGALASRLQGYTMSTAIHVAGLVAVESGRGAGVYGERADLPPVFLLGDSHCIAPAASLVPVGGRPHRVVPRYVLGLKAWHLASGVPNPYAAGAGRMAAALPGGARVIVSAGDIDCRPRSGFDNLRRRGGGEISGAIRDTTAGYLDWIGRSLGAAMVLAPPSPRLEALSDLGERAACAAIGRAFQAALAEGCAARGVPLIDLAALTRHPDGRTDPALFVDAHHLVPAALRLALMAV